MKKILTVFIISLITLSYNLSAQNLETALAGNAHSIPYAQQVDLNSGTYVVSVPITGAPGRGKMQPGVSLDYSSSTFNGFAGVGWSLTAGGSIKKNTKFGAVEYDDAPYVLTLNGAQQEITPISDTEYRCRQEGAFLKIVRTSTSPYVWEIWDKEGNHYLFDDNLTDGQSKYFASFLTKVVDVNGNYMEFSYLHDGDNRQMYLQEIKYTGNDTLGDLPLNKIQFSYEPREDKSKSYREGFEIITALRLASIEAYADTFLVCKYALNYTDSSATNRSMLNSITKYGSDGTSSLQPLTFTYEDSMNNDEFTFDTSNWLDFGQEELGFEIYVYSPVMSDINGDGKTDCMFLDGNHIYWYYGPSTGSSFETPVHKATLYDCQQCFTGDFDGDGFMDIASSYYYWNYTADMPYTRIKIYKGNGSGSFNDSSTWLDAHTPGNCAPFTGDFNGDGKTDMLLFDKEHGYWLFAFSEGYYFSNPIHYFTIVSEDYSPFTGDFNGDGFADIGYYNPPAGTVHIAFSKGSDPNNQNIFEPFNPWVYGFGYPNGVTANVVDVNNDGLSDIVFFNENNGDWWYALSNGFDGFDDTDIFKQDFGEDEKPLIGDFDGDGVIDYGYFDFNHDTDNWNIALRVDGEMPDVMTGLNNGVGGEINLTYTPSSQFDNTGGDDKPDLAVVYPVVTTMTSTDGMGNETHLDYFYEGGLFDVEDREMRGFAYAKVIDAETSTKESWFYQDDILKGKVYKEETRDSSGNLYQKAESDWDYDDLGNGITFAYVTAQDSLLYDGDDTFKQTRTEYIYDDWGNPTQVENKGNYYQNGDEVTTYTEYTYNDASCLHAHPSHTYTQDADLNTVKESWFYYDDNTNYTDAPQKGQLTKEEHWLDTGANPTIQYSYDDYGNLISTTDAQGNTTTTTYDELRHAYPVTITNPLGHTASKTYDYKTGQVLTATNPNGVTAATEYDVFGRVLKIIGPDDTVDYPKTEYEYDASALPVKITKRTKTTNEAPYNYATIYQFYDGAGRLLQTKLDAEDPALQIVSGAVEYNERGLVEKKYQPGFKDKTSDYTPLEYNTPYTTFEYDCLGRKKKVIHADGTESQTTYSDWQITHTDAESNIIIQTNDAYGRLIEIKEHNNAEVYTTAYVYDISGNLTKVTDDHANITQITYDTLGRKIQMNDPDMGVWTYNYDNNGNMTSQVDAKSQTITFTYDSLNRLTRKLADQIDVSYTYDDPLVPYSKGKLTKVTDQSGTTEFFYDHLGREIKTTKTIDATDYTVERTYTPQNKLQTVTYPDGEIITYTYNQAGEIETVTGSNTYVADINYDAKGQMTFIEYGNGSYTDYTYNPQTLRLENLKTNSGVLQNLDYTFDNVGNITQITDHTGDNTQIFQYDDLYRLTQATGHYGTKIYQYDSIGNLKEKDGITYNYGEAAGPHAVTSDSRNKVYTYDNNGNMASRGDTTYTWDCENRLTKVTKKGGLPFTLQLNLEPGWNLFSLPYDPDDNSIANVLSSINFGTDYDQVSRYNAQTDKFESYVNDAEYNEFNTFEYGDGYQIHVTNPNGCALTITGTTPEITHNYNLKAGWNLILSPTTQTKDIPDALNNLNFNIDYDQVTRYNNDNYEHYRNDPANDDFTTVDAGNSYYLYATQDTGWQIEQEVIETEFVYDGDGGRVKKITPTETTTYIGSLFEKKDDITTKHIFLGSTRVCSLKSSGTTAYYHQDHLGSTSIITDETGAEVQRVEYTPFGTTSRETGENATDYKFTGKELDATTGLYYYSARYYDPQLGRFISPDSIVQAPYDPQTLNRYSYCRNNPVKYIDPSGHSFWKKIGDWFKKSWEAIVGVATAIISIVAPPIAPIMSLINTAIGVASAVQTGNMGGLIGGVIGGALFGGIGKSLAGSIAGTMSKGFANSFMGGAIIGAVEFGVAGFGAGLCGGLAGGQSIGGALKSAGMGAAFGAATGAMIEGSYMAGWQNSMHGLSKGEIAAAQAKNNNINEVLSNFAEGRYFGTTYGEGATEYWAQRAVETGNPMYDIAGSVSALWTPETWDKTSLALTVGYGSQVAGWTSMGPEVNILYKGSSVLKVIDKAKKWGFRIDRTHHGKPWGHKHFWRW